MSSGLLVFCVISALPCVLSQITLSLSAPSSVKPSQTMKLACSVTGVPITDGSKMHAINFIRQHAGHKFVFLAHLNYAQGTAYNPSFSSRITLSRDTKENEVYLEVRGLQEDDTATYFCASQQPSGSYFDIWSQGVLVTVTEAEFLTPKVYPLLSPGPDNTISIGCAAINFFPKPAKFTIMTTTGETVPGIQNFFTALSGSPPSYDLVSEVSVSKSDFDKKTYQCLFEHFSNTIVKTIPKGCEQEPESPSVHLWQGTCPESKQNEIQITCQAYNLTSEEAIIKWYINDKERHLLQDVVEYGRTKRHFFAKYSTVFISKSEWNNGCRVKCHVTDSKTKKTAEDTIKKCSDNLNCLGINMFMVPPSIEDLYVQKIARIGCVASNLKHTSGTYSFKWSFPEAPAQLNFQTDDPVLHNNGTYSVGSFLIVSPNTWLKQTEFTCAFHHNELPTPIIITARKDKETKLLPPAVSLYPPTAEQLEKKEKLTLICACNHYKPQNIYIGWTKNNVAVPKDLHVNTQSQRESNGDTHFSMSILTIQADDWDSGTIYKCVVGHEAFPLNFVSSSIDKHSGKPTSVKISVTMSDTAMTCY